MEDERIIGAIDGDEIGLLIGPKQEHYWLCKILQELWSKDMHLGEKQTAFLLM